MELRVPNSTAFQVNTERLYQQQRATTPAQPQAEEQNFLQTLQEKDQELKASPGREAVLSMPEMATLHVLFGSEKPAEQGFYGRNSSTQIYKGHLIDVAG